MMLKLGAAIGAGMGAKASKGFEGSDSEGTRDDKAGATQPFKGNINVLK